METLFGMLFFLGLIGPIALMFLFAGMEREQRRRQHEKHMAYCSARLQELSEKK